MNRIYGTVYRIRYQTWRNRRSDRVTLQVRSDFGELGEGGFEVFGDLDSDDVGSRDLHRV